ncbi:histidine phosphatase family protein [Acetivibrio straminisolvens]|uniref:histidine phosphatase family protein n=1 Tax=Acetivibrio straminisolvens TaxID=253314 RepID=UPI00223EC488|nr:histidine phosphatase family protein [Acetivibrio straminisolvens]
MKIYITRHGETQWNNEGLMQGWKNSNLTDKGIENAKRLGERLKDIKFDVIYSSPLGRAIDTAKYINEKINAKVVLVESLKEMGFGIWEGMELNKIKELYFEQYTNFWERPHLYKPQEDGESFQELLVRVRNAWDEIIKAGGDNILIVTHAVVLKAIYMIIKKLPIKDFWNPPFMKDTCLTIVEATDNKVEIILEADTSHLK